MNTAPNILVVEDNTIAQKIAKLILAQANAQTTIAENGAAAIEKSSQQTFDLIFMDLGLPDHDGITVTESIRTLDNSKNQNTPIVALTSHSDQLMVDNCLDAGMNDFLCKPLSLEGCQALIEKYVGTQALSACGS